ncbi:MAG: porin, partial [Rhizobiales bacterium]|nr:porin [Hyphomicrobiales bacterium]
MSAEPAAADHAISLPFRRHSARWRKSVGAADPTPGKVPSPLPAQSLLLGTAAGFIAIAGAQAADLPGKAAPAEYVRICDTYGAGFFFIPGTDT